MTDVVSNEEEPLTPQSLSVLLDRITREWSSRQRIFDLPTARFYNVEDGPDLSSDFLGRRISTPVGPAAGPHTQLAQNIVLAWLGGGRLFELKTVQVIDDLVINRPCIDMETIGFNTEWSQELKVSQSLEEYVKAWMMLDILAKWDPLTDYLGSDPGDHVFDLSVGYDLEGIKTEKVAAFIRGMRNATPIIDAMRKEMTGEWAQFADLDFNPDMSDTLTLSTFHGCPPEQIELITKHLIADHDLNVIVKLNPTLLGYDRVGSILHDTLGFTELQLDPKAFDADLQFERGIELIGDLQQFAADHGKEFGIKLTNTMIVNNHKGFLGDDTMYMSGPPLHVLAMTVLSELNRALPGQLRVDGHSKNTAPIQVSWSAGIDKTNVADTLRLGIVPTTICSDLLKPGGFGRLAPLVKQLGKDVVAAGHDSLASFVAATQPGAVDAYVATLYAPDTNSAYTKEGTSKLPRSVDHDLEMWGCVACNFCVTVCPNDAFLKLPSPESWGNRWEYVVLAESCNECGNCMVFCPEDGDPAQIKPKLYLNEHRFENAVGPAFLIGKDDNLTVIRAGDAVKDQVANLTEVLAGTDGLPIRPHQ